MTRDDIIKIEQYRRFLRPDWRRWLPGDPERGLTPEQIKAQRHDFMLRDRAFETPLARRLRKEQEEREQIEQERLERQRQETIQREVLEMKAELAEMRFELVREELRWKAECAARKRQADIAWERFMAAFRRGDYRQKANFNPDQPRDELGRWTSEDGESQTRSTESDGGAESDRQVLSDETSDPIRPGAQYAQDEPRGRPIDLLEEERLGGHAIGGHVGKSEDFLLNRAREDALSAERKGDFFDGLRVGSFSSLEAANRLVNATIAQNPAKVEVVASGQSPKEELTGRFDSITGYEAYARNERSQPYIRDTDGVMVVIVRDRQAEKGYRVDSAFPVRFGR